MQALRTVTRQLVSKSLELGANESLKGCVEAVLSDTTSVALEVSKVFRANLTTELSQCVVNATDPAIDLNAVGTSTFLELVQSEAAGVLRKSWIIVKDFSDAGAVLINDMELDPSTHSEAISVINLM